MRLHNINFGAPIGDIVKLDEIARKRRVSRATILRELIAAFVGKNWPVEPNKQLDWIDHLHASDPQVAGERPTKEQLAKAYEDVARYEAARKDGSHG